MNKHIKRIIALVLAINTFSTISGITTKGRINIDTTIAYASSYSPSADELKTLKIKSTNGDSLDLRDGYNGDTVKLSDDKEYYAKLTDDSDGITIDAEAKGEDEVVRIFTSDKSDATEYKSGDKILLGKGDNTIYVRTYNSLDDYRKAKNQEKDVTQCEEEYTINVRKTQESDSEDDNQDPIYLDNIKLSQGDISFLRQRTNYDVKVDSSVSEIKITATPEDESDRVRVNGTIVDSNDNYRENVSLDNGKNEIKIKVTDSHDNQRTYTLNVTRGDDSDSNDDIYLDNLKIDHGTLDFSRDKDSYDVEVDDAVNKLMVTAEPEDEDYVVKINGDEVKSNDDYQKDVSLSKGDNNIKVLIEDELNDKKRAYTINVKRGTEDNNNDTKNSDTIVNNKSKWVQTDKGWQYYNEDGNIVKSSWIQDKGTSKWYFVDANGYKLLGWQYINGKWYMLDTATGEMKIGWYKEAVTNKDNSKDNKTENWYYLDSDGSMKMGWFSVGGVWYYFNKSGVMQKGWIVDSNSKYYLNDTGAMVTGTQTIDNKEYKFAANGVLQS